MLKRILAVVFALAVLAGTFCGCDNRAVTDNGDKLSVVATNFPLYDFARQVCGDRAKVSMLLPPGTESHAFDPTPQDIIGITNADLFLYIGGVSDSWVNGILDSVENTDLVTAALFDSIEAHEKEFVEGMQHDETDHADGHGKAEYDEHIWTSPKNAVIMVDEICGLLCSVDADGASVYTANAAAYTEKLLSLDNEIRQAVKNAKTGTVVFADRFPFLYFAKEYGVEYFSAFPGCATETEPSAATVKFLIDKVNANKIPVVFYIEFSNERMADTICEATGAKKLLFHSCHNVSRADFDAGITYIDLMSNNLSNLKEALA